MTVVLMKALGRHFSTLFFAVPLLAAAPLSRAESNVCGPVPATAPDDQTGKLAYPTFCSIPKRPGDVRSPAAFKAAVLDTRRSGLALVRATGPGTFGLRESGADSFAREARAEAKPPAPMNPQNMDDAAAFARDAREKVAPPKRPH